MSDIDSNTDGCSKHGRFDICGHTDVTCPDKATEAKEEQSSGTEKAVSAMIENLEKCGFYPDFQGPEAEKRKQQLIEIARNMPAIAIHVLRTFRQLMANESLDGGKLAFFVVGGRVAATPIKDNTDFDIVIAAEKRHLPIYNNITWKQRHAIGNALYPEIEKLFKELGIDQLYEKGIIEIKGLGEKTPEEVEEVQDTLRIIDLD